jgi:YfiH family protein
MSAARRLTLPELPPGALDCPIPVSTGMQAGITLAAAGDMRLSRAGTSPGRAHFLARAGIPADRLYSVRQVHSHRVQVIDGQPVAEVAAQEADGLLTLRPDAVLSVTVADCLPIFLVDKGSGAFGVVHSGWRGTGIVAEALSLLQSRFGARPRDVTAVLGPGIGPCCYTVPRGRADLFRSRYGPGTVREDGDAPRLDLRAANLVLLQKAGVQDISVVTACTSCTLSLGSFRRQGPSGFTLMLAWIGRAPGEAAASRGAGGITP